MEYERALEKLPPFVEAKWSAAPSNEPLSIRRHHGLIHHRRRNAMCAKSGLGPFWCIEIMQLEKEIDLGQLLVLHGVSQIFDWLDFPKVWLIHGII